MAKRPKKKRRLVKGKDYNGWSYKRKGGRKLYMFFELKKDAIEQLGIDERLVKAKLVEVE